MAIASFYLKASKRLIALFLLFVRTSLFIFSVAKKTHPFMTRSIGNSHNKIIVEFRQLVQLVPSPVHDHPFEILLKPFSCSGLPFKILLVPFSCSGLPFENFFSHSDVITICSKFFASRSAVIPIRSA